MFYVTQEGCDLFDDLCMFILFDCYQFINPLNTELNPIYHLLALLGAHPLLHVSRIRVNTEHKNWYGINAFFQ
jgi:hypothetical protein